MITFRGGNGYLVFVSIPLGFIDDINGVAISGGNTLYLVLFIKSFLHKS